MHEIKFTDCLSHEKGNLPPRACQAQRWLLLVLLALLVFGAGLILLMRPGWLVSYLSLPTLYAFIFLSLERVGFFARLRVQKARDVLLILISSLAFLAILCHIISQESWVYYWDNAAYWYKSLELFERFDASTFSALDGLRLLYSSINYSEYNYLLAYFMAVPLKLAGGSYLAFELLVATLFILPFECIISAFIQDLVESYDLKKPWFGYIFLISLCFPLFFLPLLDGYIDGAVLLVIASCYYLTLKMPDERAPGQSILLGLMAALVLVLRRYFAYWLVGYGVFAFGMAMSRLLRQPKGQRIELGKHLTLNYGLSILVALAALLIGCTGMLKTMLFTDYEAAFSGYNVLGLWGKFQELGSYLGTGILGFAAVGSMGGLGRLRLGTGFLLFASTLVTCLAFYHTQNMGLQHYNVVAVQIFILFVSGFILLLDLIKRATFSWGKRAVWGQGLLSVLFALLVVGNLLQALSFVRAEGISQEILVGRAYAIKTRNDLDALDALDSYLSSLVDGSDEESVYVLASSTIFNSDVMRKVNAPDLSLGYDLLMTNDVDLRDGFPIDFLDASIVVVGDPIQTHMSSPDSQRVITLLAEEFLSERSIIASNYIEDSSFNLDDNVVARVFIRVHPYTEDQINYIRTEYDTYYSDYPELFVDRFDEYLNK